MKTCPLQSTPPGSSKPLRDAICGLRNIDWDHWTARLAAWLLDRAPVKHEWPEQPKEWR